jgi:hypothetical protein
MSTNLDRLDASGFLQLGYLGRIPGELERNTEKTASAATRSPYNVADQSVQLLHGHALRDLNANSCAGRQRLGIQIRHFCIRFKIQRSQRPQYQVCVSSRDMAIRCFVARFSPFAMGEAFVPSNVCEIASPYAQPRKYAVLEAEKGR